MGGEQALVAALEHFGPGREPISDAFSPPIMRRQPSPCGRSGLPGRGTAPGPLARHPTQLLARPFGRRPQRFGQPKAESLRARAAEIHEEWLDGFAAIVHVLRAPLHLVALDALLIWHLCASSLGRV